MAKEKKKDKRYWFCLIGAVDQKKIKSGSDTPLRLKVKESYKKVAGEEDYVCKSGWNIDEEMKDLLDVVLHLEKTDHLYQLLKEIAKKRLKIK